MNSIYFTFLFAVTRGYLPRSILTPLISSPSPPTRQDIVQAPQPLPRTTLKRTTEQSPTTNNEPIYLNHEYAAIEQEQVIYLIESSF